MAETSICLKKVSKYYKLYDSPKDRLKEALHPFGKKFHQNFYALNNVNLEIGKGELVGIIGRNGAGKSTLLRIVAGILQPNSGEIIVHGRISALLELGSGFNPEFTGIENIYFYGTILGFSRQEMGEKVDNIIRFANIGKFINQPIKTYSSGMRARLSFSVATNIEPEILIVDEVLSVGDIRFRRKSYDRMKGLMNCGTTVLLVSHDTNTINEICERALMFHKGNLVLDGSAKDVTKMYLKSISTNNGISNSSLQKELRRIEDSKNEPTIEKNKKEKMEDGSFYSKQVGKTAAPVWARNFPVELVKSEITNLNKEKVNVITHGHVYKLQLSYQFNESVSNVVFPIAFHTLKGLEIYGIRYPDNETAVDLIKEGQTVNIEWNFKTSFMPGYYYLSAGVTHLIEFEKEIYLRVEDLLAFKVMEYKKRVHWGMISVDFISQRHYFSDQVEGGLKTNINQHIELEKIGSIG